MTEFEEVLETILEEYARRDAEGDFDTWEETDSFVKEKAEVLLAYANFKEKPVSEELEEAADSYIKTHGEILGFGRQIFKAGAEWQMNKLPKWRRTPIQGGCWSGEIGVRPTARLFVYEHYSINADKLFKLLNRED